MSYSLLPLGLQHARPSCPSPTPRACWSSCPLSWWCRPTISSSVTPFSSCPQSFPASGSFPVSQLFAWGGQRIGASASASVLPMNTQDWSPLGWTGWISLQSKGLSRVFSNTTAWPIPSLHVLSSLEAQAVFKRVYKPLSLTVSFHFTTFSMHTNVHKNCASFVLFLFLQIV